MKDIRQQINIGFEQFGLLIYRKWRLALFMSILFFIATVFQISELTIDTSTEGFFHKDDPAILMYNEFREQFGRDSVLFVVIEPPELFDKVFLNKLKQFQDTIEERVPHLNEVLSLINVTSIRGEQGELVVEDLMEDWPEDIKAIELLKQRVLSYRLYQNFFISEDGRYTSVVIRSEAYSNEVESDDDGFGEEDEALVGDDLSRIALTEEENAQFVEAVKLVVSEYQSEDFKIYLAGSPSIGYYLQERLMTEAPLFTISAVIVISLLLLLLFRRVSGVFIPMLIVLLSLTSTIGIMAATGYPFTTVTQILPAFIISVGVGASVHLLVIFYQHFMDTDDKEKSIAYAMGHSGLPMLLTSLTTAAGLLSFANAEIAPIGSMGVFSALGVMLALMYTLVLTPVLIAVVPLKQVKMNRQSFVPSWMENLLTRLADFSTNRPWSICLVSLLVVAAGIFGASKLIFSHDPLTWLPKDDKLVLDTKLIDREMKGSMSLEIVIDTGKEDGLYEPEMMNLLEKVNQDIERMEEGKVFVGKSTSIVDTLKEINKALNENRENFYVVPQNRNLIAQEFLLFSNSGADDLENIVDTSFSKARISVKIPWLDANSYVRFVDQLEDYLKDIFKEEAKVTVTGMMMLLSKTMYHMIKTMMTSYLIAGLVISIMMILLIGNIRIGLLSMIPNFFPIILGMGLMGILGFPLDMSSILIGSIAMGIAVDDTVHFMHNFRRYYREMGSAGKAIHSTLQTTGRAMVFTTLIISSGCMVFTMSNLSNLVRFGTIISFVVVMALLADILLAPALMVLVTRKGWKI